ncbi:MAG TPA: hypothetical protein VFB14_06000 [Bryobacteraceae bacterium]|nr:hypothetical protein [Bryobacteraceae bacterium]
MVSRSRTRFQFAKLAAFVCLGALLVVVLAVPLHKHAANQDGACLICHATERANVVSVDCDAGKPLVTCSGSLEVAFDSGGVRDVPGSRHTSRAPPSPFVRL